MPGTHREPAADGSELLAVPHTIETTRLARNCGVKLGAPIMYQYDWAGDTPYKSQKLTAAMLTMNPRAYVLSEMGTGKTRASLHAFNSLLQSFEARKMLVVAPLSSLNPTWGREILLHFPHLSVGILHGSRAKRLKVLAEDHQVYVINHDGVETIASELIARTDIDVVNLDELSVYKNASTKRWKVINRVIQGRKYVWGMTGTPAAREPTDAWAQCRLLTPHTVPKSVRRFRAMTMVQVSQFRWIAKSDSVETVYQAMQPGVRFTRDEWDIPARIDVTREVQMSPEQKTVYTELVRHMKADLKAAIQEDGSVKALNAGALFNKLMQVAGGWVYTSDKQSVVSLNPASRLQELQAAVDEAVAKTIVFTAFDHAAEGVFNFLTANGYSCELVTGAVPVGKRNQIFADFQNTPKPHIIVAHPGCMSHSLTLTAASMIVWYTPITSLETYLQACARITRAGQKNKQMFVHLSGTPVERMLYRRLQEQASLQDALLELFEIS